MDSSISSSSSSANDFDSPFSSSSSFSTNDLLSSVDDDVGESIFELGFFLPARARANFTLSRVQTLWMLLLLWTLLLCRWKGTVDGGLEEEDEDGSCDDDGNSFSSRFGGRRLRSWTWRNQDRRLRSWFAISQLHMCMCGCQQITYQLVLWNRFWQQTRIFFLVLDVLLQYSILFY